MRKKIAGIIILCLLGISLSLIAQEKPLKIGVINTQKLIAESVEGKKMLSYLETKQREKAQEIEAMRTKLQQDLEQFQRQQNSLSDEARIRRQSELNRRRTDLDRYLEDANAEMQALQGERWSQIERQIRPLIQQLGAEQGFTLILEGHQGMLYVDASIDITDELIVRFDRASSGTSQPPQNK